MSFELLVSLRYLMAKRRQAFVSLITLISMLGVTVGVMALIVVLAVMSGFQEDLRDRILGVTSHIVIGNYRGNFADYPQVIRKVSREDQVVAATPIVYTQVMLTSRSASAGAVLRGIDPISAPKVTQLDRNMKIGSIEALQPRRSDRSGPKAPGIVLGVELATRLGVGTHDYVTVLAPSGRLTPMGRLPRSELFQVVGLFQSGMFEYDNTLSYMALSQAQHLLGIGNTVTAVEVRVKDIYQADSVARRLRNTLGFPYWVRDWMQMNHNLFSALKLEKVVMFIILTLIIVVAAFNIVSSLIMMVTEKTRDIAILKAMGATEKSIRQIFVLEGFLIGMVGTVLGIVSGLTLCSLLERYKFIELPKDVYYISTLPVKIEPTDVALIALAAVLICLAATFYPSRQAAKLHPAEALRYE